MINAVAWGRGRGRATRAVKLQPHLGRDHQIYRAERPDSAHGTDHQLFLPSIMDRSDVGFRHSVAFSSLNINHSVDLSPSAVSIAREVRISIIAIALAFVSISIVRGLSHKRPTE